MYSRDNFYEVELGRYTVLYFLLGVVEHELRARIPIALSDYAYTSGKLDWWDCLHHIFPKLSKPLSKESYDQVCNRIFRAYVLRNKVAHYEFLAVQKYENEKSYLLWLINAMGGPSA